MPGPSEETRPAATAAPGSPRWWVSDRKGHLAVVQAPNAALMVWIVTVVLGWTDLLDTDDAAAVRGVGRGALIVWGLDELMRGASPFRRILGAVVLGFQLFRLFA